MSKKKLFVTGISGFLGWYIGQEKSEHWEIIGGYNNNPPNIPGINAFALDLTNTSSVDQVLDQIQPDAILHLAAASNANFCEQHPEISHQINVVASLHLAEYSRKKQIPFLFTSSDLIFDGQQAPYAESSEAKPICVYGQHKVEAEKGIQSAYPGAIIARPPLMYGVPQQAKNFLPFWIKALESKQNISAFTDEYRSPASGRDVAKGIFLLLNEGASGVWNLGGAERISRYDFAILMAKTFNLPNALIQASLQKEVKMPAARPADVSMDSSKALSIGYQPMGVIEGLALEKKVYLNI